MKNERREIEKSVEKIKWNWKFGSKSFDEFDDVAWRTGASTEMEPGNITAREKHRARCVQNGRMPR